MRVLVLGGGGQIATAVAETAPDPGDVLLKTRAEIDIADGNSLDETVARGGVDWIVNAAAYTAVDRAEGEPELAQLINDSAVGRIRQAADRHGCRLLHLSTDFVFDGSSNRAYLPTAKTSPLSVYGKTKLGGEEQALRMGGNAIVLRTAWVYASTGHNFPLTMLRLMRERNEVRVVSDQIGTPTWATGIAQAIWALMKYSIPGGIYHWTDIGLTSWYDFAVAIQDEALSRGLLSRAVPIIPISTEAYPTAARRPTFSVLNCDSTRSLMPGLGRHWRHNLRSMLDELRTA
jgi:dTDP-4-dehydrorhamnose reductase